MIKVKCPICKQENRIKRNQQKVYGLSESCVVCMDNTANIFFPSCGHVCTCSKCLNLLVLSEHRDGYNIPYDENYLLGMKYNLEDIKSKLKEYPCYVNILNGLGIYTCIRRLNNESELECLICSPDDIYDNNKMRRTKDFIEGYAYIRVLLYHDI